MNLSFILHRIFFKEPKNIENMLQMHKKSLFETCLKCVPFTTLARKSLTRQEVELGWRDDLKVHGLCPAVGLKSLKKDKK